MLDLNDYDLLLIKYMILGSGLVTKEDIKKANEWSHLSNIIKAKEIQQEISENIIKEALFYGNCFSILHLNNGCPEKYSSLEWGDVIPDEIILFVRLFQHLELEEFANMLQSCTNTTLEEFQSLEFDVKDLNENLYLKEIVNWLESHNNDFAENVKRMARNRTSTIGNSITQVTKEGLVPNCDDRKESKKLRGICVVISNENFDLQSKREGTKVDEKNIKKTFKDLGYDVKIHRDVKFSDMNSIFNKTKEKVEKFHRMLIFFVLSHGEKDFIFTVDNVEVPFEQIWKPFSNNNFPKFNGKPKLFFFACCQGSELNPGVDVSSDSNIAYDGPTPGRIRYPAVASLFFGFSTCPSYLSCRTPKLGTFYVRHLCDVIRENPKASISDIHQEVQRIVSLDEISSKRGFQMPYFICQLTDPAFFMDSDDEVI